MNNRKKRIGILGIGGIGGFVGGLLAQHYQGNPEVEIIFICRGETLEAIQQHGLELKGKSGNFKVFPVLVSNQPAVVGVLDVLIVTTKTYSLSQVLQEYGATIGENTLVLPLQNSVTASSQILQQIPDRGIVLEGCIYVASNLLSPGVVQHLGGPGKIFFGADKTEPYRWLEKLFLDAQIQATLVPNMQEVLWSKFIFVAPIAAITTAYQLTFGQLLASREYKELLEQLMKEIHQLALAKGVSLKESIIDESLRLIEQFPFETKSSLQLDIEKGKPSEYIALVAYVLTESEKLGLNPIAYQQVHRVIKAISSSEAIP